MFRRVVFVWYCFVAIEVVSAFIRSPPPPDYSFLLNGNTCRVNATADNKTDVIGPVNDAIQQCRSSFPTNGVVYFPGTEQEELQNKNERQVHGPNAFVYRISRSVALYDNITLLLGKNVTLQFAVTPEMPVFQHPDCPTLYWPQSNTGLICGTNISNIAVVGLDQNSSIIDGGGWSWYEAGIANKSMWGQGPRLFEVAWTRNITLASVTVLNGPSWTIHPTFSSDVLIDSVRLFNPRFTPNTGGIMPDSASNVVVKDCVVDTGDDGVAISSMNSTEPDSRHIQIPTRNVHVYRTTILSRNFCFGSGTFGGIYDIVVEDCEIGDDHGSAPWAIKYKSHQSYVGAMVNHTFRRIRVGNIQPNAYQQPTGGFVLEIRLRYHPVIPNRTCQSWDCPLFQDVTFEDIIITGAKRAGDLSGLEGDLLQGLTFRNVTFVNPPPTGWSCAYTNLSSLFSDMTDPPLNCSDGPIPPLRVPSSVQLSMPLSPTRPQPHFPPPNGTVFPSFYFPGDINAPDRQTLARRHQMLILDGGAGGTEHAAMAGRNACEIFKNTSASRSKPCLNYRQGWFPQQEFDLERAAVNDSYNEGFWTHYQNNTRFLGHAWNFANASARDYYVTIATELAQQAPSVDGAYFDDLDGEGCYGDAQPAFPPSISSTKKRDMYLGRLKLWRQVALLLNSKGQTPLFAPQVMFNQSVTSCMMDEQEWLSHIGDDVGFFRFAVFGPLKRANATLCNAFILNGIEEMRRGIHTLVYSPLANGNVIPEWAIAGFLILRGNYSYFGASTGWQDDDWQWHDEYDVDYGLPLGPPVVESGDTNSEGLTFRRNYSRGAVTLDCASGIGRIDWW